MSNSREPLKAMISIRFSGSYKRRPDQTRSRAIWQSDVGFVLEEAVVQKSAFVRSVQLWSVKQRTMEAEEVADSWIRTKGKRRRSWSRKEWNES
jgi:hypothetical protein